MPKGRRVCDRHAPRRGDFPQPRKTIGVEDYFAILSAYAAKRSDAEAKAKIRAALSTVAEIRKMPSSRA
jgi:hypothetical protein